jgi:hypothetical protein
LQPEGGQDCPGPSPRSSRIRVYWHRNRVLVIPCGPTMNHINWDALPEPVRQFLRGLVAAPEGSVIEQNGEPVVRVLPVPKPANGPPPDVEWTESKNRRRCDLIDREIDGTLTPDERIELEDLQQQLRRYVDKVAPLSLEPLRKLHQELLDKAAKNQPASPA